MNKKKNEISNLTQELRDAKDLIAKMNVIFLYLIQYSNRMLELYLIECTTNPVNSINKLKLSKIIN